jgi:hypothetical protein
MRGFAKKLPSVTVGATVRASLRRRTRAALRTWITPFAARKLQQAARTPRPRASADTSGAAR